jgi:hypothetical protein
MESRPLEHPAHGESSRRVKRPSTKDNTVQGRSPSRRLPGLATAAVSDRILLNSSTELADWAFLTNTIDPADLLRPASGVWDRAHSRPVTGDARRVRVEWELDDDAHRSERRPEEAGIRSVQEAVQRTSAQVSEPVRARSLELAKSTRLPQDATGVGQQVGSEQP